MRETRLLAERDAAQTAHAALLAAQSAPASSGAPAPWWRSWWPWLALIVALVVAGVLLAWPRANRSLPGSYGGMIPSSLQMVVWKRAKFWVRSSRASCAESR